MGGENGPREGGAEEVERRGDGSQGEDGQDGHKVEFPSEFPSGMDRRSPEDDFPRTFPEVELPSKFPASAADNERLLERRHEPSKAAIYRTATRAEFPSGEAAIYRVTILQGDHSVSAPDQASKRT